MLSHRYKCLFIHIPKCGGTTVEEYFYICIENWRYSNIPHLPEMRKQGLTEVLNAHPDYFSFTFVRNPYDRFVSYYLHGLRRQRQKKLDRCYRNFRECLELTADLLKNRTLETPKSAQFGPLQNRYGCLWYPSYHCRLQKEFLPDCNPETLFGVQRVNSAPCSFIGRLENFGEDFRLVQRILGMPALPAPRYETSKRKHYSAYYDPASRRMVEELYAEDFELLGYTYEQADAVSRALPPLYDLQKVEQYEHGRSPGELRILRLCAVWRWATWFLYRGLRDKTMTVSRDLAIFLILQYRKIARPQK